MRLAQNIGAAATCGRRPRFYCCIPVVPLLLLCEQERHDGANKWSPSSLTWARSTRPSTVFSNPPAYCTQYGSVIAHAPLWSPNTHTCTLHVSNYSILQQRAHRSPWGSNLAHRAHLHLHPETHGPKHKHPLSHGTDPRSRYVSTLKPTQF